MKWWQWPIVVKTKRRGVQIYSTYYFRNRAAYYNWLPRGNEIVKSTEFRA